jgi:hypothetical protein
LVEAKEFITGKRRVSAWNPGAPIANLHGQPLLLTACRSFLRWINHSSGFSFPLCAAEYQKPLTDQSIDV